MTPAGPGGVTQTDTTVTGTSGNDTIDCGGASPGKTITGGLGNDTITGTLFDDTINGGTGNDRLDGGAGTDELKADAGDDWLSGTPTDLAVDTLDGGVGSDSCLQSLLVSTTPTSAASHIPLNGRLYGKGADQ